MKWPQGVIVHSLDHARAALRPGHAVTLLSAPGAAAWLGPLLWRELMAAARAAHPATPCHDILDCGDAPGHAVAALRAGCRAVVLEPACPAFAAVAGAAASHGALVLAQAPPALDLAQRGALRGLAAWLAPPPP